MQVICGAGSPVRLSKLSAAEKWLPKRKTSIKTSSLPRSFHKRGCKAAFFSPLKAAWQFLKAVIIPFKKAPSAPQGKEDIFYDALEYLPGQDGEDKEVFYDAAESLQDFTVPVKDPIQEKAQAPLKPSMTPVEFYRKQGDTFRNRRAQTTFSHIDYKKVFDVIVNFENYPSMLKGSGITSVKSLKDSGHDGPHMEFTATKMKFNDVYDLKYTLTPPKDGESAVISWELGEAHYQKSNQGKITLTPTQDGGTEIDYEVEMETIVRLDWLGGNKVFDKTVKEALEGFYKASLS